MKNTQGEEYPNIEKMGTKAGIAIPDSIMGTAPHGTRYYIILGKSIQTDPCEFEF